MGRISLCRPTCKATRSADLRRVYAGALVSSIVCYNNGLSSVERAVLGITLTVSTASTFVVRLKVALLLVNQAKIK